MATKGNGKRPDWISNEQMRELYRDAVAVCAADAPMQQAWMRAERLPSDEIRQQLGDLVFSYQGALVAAGLLSADAVRAVALVLDEFESWTDVSLWRSDEAMDRPEWVGMRKTARAALAVIDAVSPGP